MINLNNKKVLLIRNDNIGDLVCTTPVIEAIKKRYPQVQLDIVVNSLNHLAIYNHPHIQNIYCYIKPKHKNRISEKLKALSGKLKILWQIKQQHYDVVIVLRSEYSKSAELFSRITQASHKVGVKNSKGIDDYNIHITPNYAKHEVLFCFDFVTVFDISYNNERPKFFINNTLVKKYNKYNDHILFHISSRKLANQYDKKNFKTIIDNLTHNSILISAEPQDYNDAKWLENNTKATLIQTKSLLELSGVIVNVKLFITLDGGAMHIAAALQIPTIAISGETNMKKWHPWGCNDLVVQNEYSIANNNNTEEIINKIEKIL